MKTVRAIHERTFLPRSFRPADSGLSFVEGNAESLPVFPDASFDSFTIAFGIRNVTDRDAALRGCTPCAQAQGQVSERGWTACRAVTWSSVAPLAGPLLFILLIWSILPFPFI